ncbi:MAG: ABC transporter ATP-binding protein [Chlamydiia bacterium]|nr:ABC transporter ATP-binding protein [Chlamydiia bacterium]
MNNPFILEVKELKKYFPIRKGVLRRITGYIKAVDNISFSIKQGEVVGMVGESGSGKSTAAHSLIRLLEPTEGEISFLGKDFLNLKKQDLRLHRQKLQMVFQDPLASLNPRKTILENLGEALLYHKLVQNKQEQIEAVAHILERIGLPKKALTSYPHQFSGGQQQRLSIGRAIALKPKLVICDEAVSALDLSVQAQILNLLFELKDTYKLSYLFISHDLAVVRNFCDTVLVMCKGKIVERGEAKRVFEHPNHPYTQQLLAGAPAIFPKRRSKSSKS